MKRAPFIAAAAALASGIVSSRVPARAADGIDVWEAPLAQPQIRVLIGSRGNGEVATLDDRTFSFDGRRYRGNPATVRLPSGTSGIVTTLPLDDYLYGVVPLEAPPAWPRAMLSAQAIVARTYALARRSAAREYDVTATDSDQHYGGIAAETYNSNLAVDASSGQLVSYAGAPASVVYGACCGGHTEDASLVWGHGELPYLRGVPCTYCSASPAYRWTAVIPLDEVRTALGERIAAVGAIQSLALKGIDASGRSESIAIEGSTGVSSVSASDFRRLLGAAKVKSTLIHTLGVDRAAQTVAISGGGSGHGVGLCQWGARTLALEGASATQIVGYYYPGTSIALATA